jgi:hypothetical protein
VTNALIDRGVAGGFPEKDFAFVFTPAWFTRLGADVVSSAEFSTGDFLVSGFWPFWQVSGAAGSPVVVYTSDDDSGSDKNTLEFYGI